MKYFDLSKLSIFVLLVCSSLAFAKNLDKNFLTLEIAQKRARNNSHAIKALEHQISAFEAEKGITNSSFYPRLGLIGGAGSFGETIDKINPVIYGYASYNIFNGFRDQTSHKSNDIQLEKAKLILSSEEFKTNLEVEKYFHQHIYYKDLIELQKKAITLNIKHQKLAKEMETSGRSTATDVMEFKLKDAILNSDLKLLEQNIYETLTKLRIIVGDIVNSETKFIGSIQHQHLAIQKKQYIEKVKNNGMKVQLASLDLKNTQSTSQQWKADWYPKVDLEIQAGRLPEESSENNINILLTAKYEIFSGYKSQYKRKLSEALIARDESLLNQSKLESIQSIEVIYDRLKTIEKRVDLEYQNEDYSLKYYNGISKEYRRGYRNSSDLDNAAERYLESRRRKIEFMYEFLLEKLKLEKITRIKVDVKAMDN